MNLKKLIFTIALIIVATLAAKAQTPPKYEVRAVWLTTIGGIDWPHSYYAGAQKEELTKTLDQLQHAGINTVLLQTRIRATTIYPSQYEPFDGCITGHPGQQPNYDPLKFAIDECHRRGMELHAWVVAIPVGKWNGAGCRRLRQTHPSLLKKIGDEGFLNPEAEGTAGYIANICDEIVSRYDVDGIHLDYIRYPDQWGKIRSRESARRNITRIARQVSHTVKSRKPWVKMSCSPVGKHDDLTRYSSRGWNARTAVCQDAQAWLREGIMDQLYPMMYFRGNQFFPFALDWKEQANGRTVAPGLAVYMLSPKEGNWSLETIQRELEFLRANGMGHTFFRSKFLTDNWKGIYSYVCNQLNTYPALVPPMKWMGATPPQPPTNMRVERTTSGTRLSWQGDAYAYNVYASFSYPVDTSDPRNLVAIRRRTNSITISSPQMQQAYYAVCAVDRYGQESSTWDNQRNGGNKNGRKYGNGGYNGASNLANPSSAALLPCDGRYLTLPAKPSTLSTNLVVIETMQGQIVATRRWTQGRISVADLPEGFYKLRSLAKIKRKTVTHNLGAFMIKRGNR